MKRAHAMLFGAPLAGEDAHFRLWAPSCEAVALCLAGPGAPQRHPMQAEAEGHFRDDAERPAAWSVRWHLESAVRG